MSDKIKNSEIYNINRTKFVPHNDAVMMLIVRKMLCELQEFEAPTVGMADWEAKANEAQYGFMYDVFCRTILTVFSPDEILALAAADSILSKCWVLWNEYHYPVNEIMIMLSHSLESGEI